jgi:hypothetical protein
MQLRMRVLSQTPPAAQTAECSLEFQLQMFAPGQAADFAEAAAVLMVAACGWEPAARVLDDVAAAAAAAPLALLAAAGASAEPAASPLGLPLRHRRPPPP